MVSTAELVQVIEERIDPHTDETARLTTVDIWEQLLATSAPLIGARMAFDLLCQSIHSNRSGGVEWIPSTGTITSPGAVDMLREAISNRSPSEIICMTRAVVGTYIDMIRTLIGPTLIAQIVYRVASTR